MSGLPCHGRKLPPQSPGIARGEVAAEEFNPSPWPDQTYDPTRQTARVAAVRVLSGSQLASSSTRPSRRESRELVSWCLFFLSDQNEVCVCSATRSLALPSFLAFQRRDFDPGGNMATSRPIDHVVAIPTFIGSLLSFLGSATALGFQVARPPQHHFRHSLIVNLLVAGMSFNPSPKIDPSFGTSHSNRTLYVTDLIYGLGNTISGAVFLVKGQTPSPLSAPDVACRVSGWFSQSNAQAVDFNILIISVVVLLSVVKKDSITHLETKWQILICALAWIPGFITGTSASPLQQAQRCNTDSCLPRHHRSSVRLLRLRQRQLVLDPQQQTRPPIWPLPRLAHRHLLHHYPHLHLHLLHPSARLQGPPQHLGLPRHPHRPGDTHQYPLRH